MDREEKITDMFVEFDSTLSYSWQNPEPLGSRDASQSFAKPKFRYFKIKFLFENTYILLYNKLLKNGGENVNGICNTKQCH